MPLFLLTPVDREAPDWAFSITNEPLQVEAETEELARRRANRFLAVTLGDNATSRRAGRAPWDQRQLVIARVVEEIDPAVRLILAGDMPP